MNWKKIRIELKLKKNKKQFWVFLLPIIITAVILILPYRISEGLCQSDAWLLGIISFLISTSLSIMLYAINNAFNHQEDTLKTGTDEIKELITNRNELEEFYTQILKQEDSIKDFYLHRFNNFILDLNKYVKGRRSGPLCSAEYYNHLDVIAEKIIEDKNKHPNDFKGKVWAVSFYLENEWDENNLPEKEWIKQIKKIDEKDIKTERIWVLDENELNLLKVNSVKEKDKTHKLLKGFELNLGYPNTSSYVMTEKQLREANSPTDSTCFGKGFFAVTYTDGKSELIRDVCFDCIPSENFEGEIDFDTLRIAEIKNIWENNLRLAKNQPLNDFLFSKCSDEVRNFMINTMNFKSPQDKLCPNNKT